MWDNAALLKNIANALIAFSVLAMLYGAVYYTVHLPGLFPLHSVHLGAAPQRVDMQEVLAVARNEVQGNFFTAVSRPDSPTAVSRHIAYCILSAYCILHIECSTFHSIIFQDLE